MERIITIENVNTNEYFFTTDHCQQYSDKIKIYELGSEWVPITHYLPFHVVPREGIEDGWIRTKDDLRVLMKNSIEIPNPNPNYQA